MPPFARPIPSVRPSVRMSVCLSVTSRSIAKTARDRPMVIGLWLLRGAYRKSPLGYGTQLQPLWPPFSQTWGSQLPIKNYFANCGQTVLYTRVISTDSLWEHTIALTNSTIVNPNGHCFPQNEVIMSSIGRVVGFPNHLVRNVRCTSKQKQHSTLCCMKVNRSWSWCYFQITCSVAGLVI